VVCFGLMEEPRNAGFFFCPFRAMSTVISTGLSFRPKGEIFLDVVGCADKP